MTSVWVAFVLIFAVVQLCTAEYVVYGQKMTLHDKCLVRVQAPETVKL